VHLLGRFVRWFITRLPMLIAAGLVGRTWQAWRRRSREIADRRQVERAALPSIVERYPQASTAPRRRIGLQSVPLDRIVGTMRDPSQNTADFLPLPHLRGQNWHGRWQRITTALDRLATLPPVDLVQVGDEYYVADGHNRVAAALTAGGVEIDADVTQLVIPGISRPAAAHMSAGSLVGEEEVRLAGQGRLSRTTPRRAGSERMTRRELLGDRGEDGA
jgi:hypothetical protein